MLVERIEHADQEAAEIKDELKSIFANLKNRTEDEQFGKLISNVWLLILKSTYLLYNRRLCGRTAEALVGVI